MRRFDSARVQTYDKTTASLGKLALRRVQSFVVACGSIAGGFVLHARCERTAAEIFLRWSNFLFEFIFRTPLAHGRTFERCTQRTVGFRDNRTTREYRATVHNASGVRFVWYACVFSITRNIRCGKTRDVMRRRRRRRCATRVPREAHLAAGTGYCLTGLSGFGARFPVARAAAPNARVRAPPSPTRLRGPREVARAPCAGGCVTVRKGAPCGGLAFVDVGGSCRAHCCRVIVAVACAVDAIGRARGFRRAHVSSRKKRNSTFRAT